MPAETAEALEPEVVDTPPAEPAATPEPEQAKAKPSPTIPPDFNRQFTQRSQALASIRSLAGLPETATPAEVVAAVEQLKNSVPAAVSDEGDELLSDPRYLDLQRQAESAGWTIARSEYAEVADFMRDVAAIARKERDPERLTAAGHELMLKYWPPAEDAEAPAAAAGAAPAGAAPPAAEAGFGATDDESLSARQLDQSVVEEMKGSGDLPGFFKRIGLVRVAEERRQ